MTSKLIASVVALSIGFAGLTTVPAQANDDVAKILAGIATVVIIGKVIEARNDRADSTTRRDTYDRD